MSDYALVFSERKWYDSYYGLNFSDVNYFYGGLTYRNYWETPRFEDFLPPSQCQWAYDRYPQLRNDTHNHTSTDDVIINNYANNILEAYGSYGQPYLTLNDTTRWFADFIGNFNTGEIEYRAESLALQIMWIADENRNRLLERNEL